MKAFLARFRRLFYGGTIALIITMVASILTHGKSYIDLWSDGLKVNSFDTGFELFLALTPIVYVLLVIVSSAFIRRKGQSAAYQQSKPFISTFFQCVGSDITSPFKCIAGFFTAIFNRYPSFYPAEMAKKSKFVSIRRFIWMLIILGLCIYGMMRLNVFSSLIQHFTK